MMVTVRTVERPVFGFTVIVTRQAPGLSPFTVVPDTLHREEVEGLTRRLIREPAFTVILARRATAAPVNDLPRFTEEGMVDVVVVVATGAVDDVVVTATAETVVPATVVDVVVVDVVVVVEGRTVPPRLTVPTVEGSSLSPMLVVLPYPSCP